MSVDTSAPSGKYTVFHSAGCGSVYTLALLAALNVDHEVVELDYDSTTRKEDTPEYRRLVSANPLAQFPTVITPDGTVMTETAAIAFYLHDKYAQGTPWSTANLTSSQLALFYRLMVFIPANIYPTITMIDFPERFIVVPDSAKMISKEAAVGWVEEKANENRKTQFTNLENIIASEAAKRMEHSTYALGTKDPTILDVYIAVIVQWSPRRRFEWIKTNCPNLSAIADAMWNHPVIGKALRDGGFSEPWVEYSV